jgi:predicted peroxiredoxin
MALMGKYVYCFIKEKEKLTLGNSAIGNLNAPIYTIPFKEISAVVSNAPIIEYDPTRKNMLEHERIIAKVMDKYAVVPVAFGTVANSKKEIEYIIDSNYSEFNNLTDFFKDKIELGLRITWDNNYFNKDIEDDEVKSLKEKIIGKEEKKILNEKIQLGQLVEASILSKREKYEESIYNHLKQLSVDSKLKENVSIKTVLIAYFLVKKSKEADFDKAVETLSNLYQNKLIFNYTGPWAAYNFVDLNINIK